MMNSRAGTSKSQGYLRDIKGSSVLEFVFEPLHLNAALQLNARVFKTLGCGKASHPMKKNHEAALVNLKWAPLAPFDPHSFFYKDQ